MACWTRTAGTLLVLLGASTAGRAQTTPSWIVTGSDRMHYTVQGIGDLLGVWLDDVTDFAIGHDFGQAAHIGH